MATVKGPNKIEYNGWGAYGVLDVYFPESDCYVNPDDYIYLYMQLWYEIRMRKQDDFKQNVIHLYDYKSKANVEHSTLPSCI